MSVTLSVLKTVQVDIHQTSALCKHIVHVGHVGRVEALHVDRCQTKASFEHPTHVGHL